MFEALNRGIKAKSDLLKSIKVIPRCTYSDQDYNFKIL